MDDYIDTTEAGGGSYPTPPEPKTKYYKFTCDCYVKVKIGVWAESLKEAEAYVENRNYDDLEFVEETIEIEDCLNYEIEEE